MNVIEKLFYKEYVTGEKGINSKISIIIGYYLAWSLLTKNSISI